MATERERRDRKATERRDPKRSSSSVARPSARNRLDQPKESRRRSLLSPQVDPEAFGRWSETFARFMGTAWFLVGMTMLVICWLLWNTLMPDRLQFDPKTLNFTLLTLILSLQASYAAPLILLAQNRQADRDRVSFEQDRDRSERALADTEYLAREVAALRIAMREIATRDFIRSELRALLDEVAMERKPHDLADSRDVRDGRGDPRDGRDQRDRRDGRDGRPGNAHRDRQRQAADPFGSTLGGDLPTDRE